MSKRPSLNTADMREIVDRIKDIINTDVNKKGLTYDYMVAKELKLNIPQLKYRIASNNLPIHSLKRFCKTRGVDVSILIKI